MLATIALNKELAGFIPPKTYNGISTSNSSSPGNGGSPINFFRSHHNNINEVNNNSIAHSAPVNTTATAAALRGSGGGSNNNSNNTNTAPAAAPGTTVSSNGHVFISRHNNSYSNGSTGFNHTGGTNSFINPTSSLLSSAGPSGRPKFTSAFAPSETDRQRPVKTPPGPPPGEYDVQPKWDKASSLVMAPPVLIAKKKQHESMPG